VSILTGVSHTYYSYRMIHKIIDLVFGSKHEQDLKALLPIVHEINALEQWAVSLSPEMFPQETEKLKARHAAGESLDDLLPAAYALVREAARRVLGERLYDVQLLGGIVLHQGKIMEMKTGEGKTVSSVTAAYLNALPGEGVHIVTVNEYLAERDAAWMGPVFSYLGLTVGWIVSRMENEARKEAYQRDITYGTNSEFGFDYLRDNMAFDHSRKVQPGHHYAIVDEIDSILIDEARTPLIISGAAEDDTRKYVEVDRIARDLVECDKDPETEDYPDEPVGDYKLDEKSRKVSFTDQGLNHMEELLMKRKIITSSLFLEENFEYIHYFTQALRAQRLFHRDTHYVVSEGQVQIVDEFTGRILHGRRYSDGLHQAIEAKEGIRIAQRNRTLATITLQNFFRMYAKLSGMTGTAETEAKEFGMIYGLDVVVIPSNRPLARVDQDDVIYVNENAKYQAIAGEIKRVNDKGQPMLIGTASIERSEKLSNVLTRAGVRHEVLNAKNHAREALIIAEAGAKSAVTIATNMAGRGTDIKLGGNPEFRARRKAGTAADEDTYNRVYPHEYQKWRGDYEEVRSLGGLYVLGTERHESRRIDNQLRGRSGRQGDPGESRFFLSMDDDLMRLFGRGSDRLKSIMQRGMEEDEPLNHRFINRTIESAQSKVEERNFDIRKHLLEYDDVLNEQRKLIYNQRDAILSDDNLIERVWRSAVEVVDELIQPYVQSRGEDAQLLHEFLTGLHDTLFFTSETSEPELAVLNPEQLREQIVGEIWSDLKNKAGIAGHEQLNLAIRDAYLRSIDKRWQDHLENLEALREAVYLRSYAQKNPLLEYKLEGFQIFDQLIYDIRTSIARKVIAVKAEGIGRPTVRREAAPAGTPMHNQMQVFAAGGRGGDGAPAQSGGGAATATATRPQKGQVTRTYPKVGRNDPCPCGSGKKYKHCHGR